MSNPSAIHLVTVQPHFASLILAGRKTLESRFTKTRRVPFGMVNPGDRLYFKAVSGPVVATAIASEIESHDELTPADVIALGVRHAAALCAPAEYFESKRNSRYATIVTLTRVEPVEFGPRCDETTPGTPRDGWRVLPDSMDVYPACRSLMMFEPDRTMD